MNLREAAKYIVQHSYSLRPSQKFYFYSQIDDMYTDEQCEKTIDILGSEIEGIQDSIKKYHHASTDIIHQVNSSMSKNIDREKMRLRIQQIQESLEKIQSL